MTALEETGEARVNAVRFVKASAWEYRVVTERFFFTHTGKAHRARVLQMSGELRKRVKFDLGMKNPAH
jgi:hypothetical protein